MDERVLQCFEGDIFVFTLGLAFLRTVGAVAAVVIVLFFMAVDGVAGNHRATAVTAKEHRLKDGFRFGLEFEPFKCVDDGLYFIKDRFGNDGLMKSRVFFAFPSDDSFVNGISEDVVEAAHVPFFAVAVAVAGFV